MSLWVKYTNTRICVLQITQRNISHPKLLMVNYINWINYISKSISLVCCADSSMLIWKLQRTEFLSKVCKFAFCKLHKLMQIILNHWLLVIISWRLFLLIKTCFYAKIAENWIFRQSSNSLLTRQVRQIGVLQIAQHEMVK